MIWQRKRKKEKILQQLHQQREENIKELKKIGIHYVSSEQYYKNKNSYNFAMSIVPTYRPTIFERLNMFLARNKK